MSTSAPSSPLLVVSAHAGDFVWRAAGAIALATSRGDRAKVVCLSYGERGESARAWREGKGLEEIKELRRGEAEAAAAELGAEIEFLDAGDYPLRETPELVDRLVRVYREFEPAVVLTHTLADPYNGDHPAAARMALQARVLAQAIGYEAPGEPLGRRRCSSSSRTSRSSATSSPTCSWTSRRCSTASARRWSACPRSSTCGTTTPTSPSGAASS
ncbi:PIG-L family deacetylase [Actinomadura madurae]|uniref:PIG-L deacetylase family protein n=1 Tax=Actinomadura madurae TaxID=1993 RepID=UPI0020D2322E|nr:PIG-L family deacetylase [Actinomadura madurae]MCP9970844.1 PIG-L family deacetylase [Actinomadura madurae]